MPTARGMSYHSNLLLSGIIVWSGYVPFPPISTLLLGCDNVRQNGSIQWQAPHIIIFTVDGAWVTIRRVYLLIWLLSMRIHAKLCGISWLQAQIYCVFMYYCDSTTSPKVLCRIMWGQRDSAWSIWCGEWVIWVLTPRIFIYLTKATK